LLDIAERLAASEPPRELIVLRLLESGPGTQLRGGLKSESRRLQGATRELQTVRRDLASRGVHARTAALTSIDPAADIVKIAEREQVDLVMLDGRRRLVGAAIPAGPLRGVLERAAPDVVVLASGDPSRVPPEPGAPIVVPFGGAPHDWAALELGAWLSTAFDAPLRLLGTVKAEDLDDPDEDPSRLLANASLMLQRFIGVESEPVIVEAGEPGLLEAAQGSALLVVGLSDRWTTEGLGQMRGQLARAAPAPILFVRRGTRPGVLAGRDDVTRFTWSVSGK